MSENTTQPYQHGELVTVADLDLEFVHQEGPWVEVVPPGSDVVGFTVHESQVSSR